MTSASRDTRATATVPAAAGDRSPVGTAGFGRVLYDSIRRRGWSASRFARTIGMSSAFISGVHSRSKKPPLDKLEEWADVLGFEGLDRDAFILLAHLEHTTPLLRHLFMDYREVARAAHAAGIRTVETDLLLHEL